MANSPEHDSMLDCTPELGLAVQSNIVPLSGELLRARLISEDKDMALRNRNTELTDRAADLVSLVTNEVRADPENYHKFVAILKKDKQRYKTVLAQLEKTYKDCKGVMESPGPKPSSGQDNVYGSL
jgi:hypothetical protein